MTASETQGAARASLTALVDYAGLFPPAQLEVEAAMAEYLEAQRGAYAWLLGRFITRHSQARRVLAAVPAGERVHLSVILDGGTADLESAAAFRRETRAALVDVFEAALEPDVLAEFAAERSACGLDTVPIFVETRADALAHLGSFGFGAKIRCGGVRSDAYPTPEAVAQFISFACKARVPFKATAGLHHPVRHFNRQAGVTMHGFLNLLAACALARAGAGDGAVLEAIVCEDASQFGFDGARFRFGSHEFDAPFMAALRSEAFVAYGSCSFSEPVEDLRAMGALR